MLTASGNTTLATPEPGEPPHTPGADRAGSSVWWRWTAFGDGPVYLISTAAYAHGLAVYTGDRLDALEVRARSASAIVISPSQRSVLSFMARAGTEYRIALEARAAPGPFELNLNATLPLEQPLLLWTDPLPGHELGLRVRVGRPSTVIVEESSDLQHWTARDPIFIENERVIAIPHDGVARYLRAFSP